MSFIAFFQNNKLVTFEDIISYILSMTSCELIQNEIDISRTLALFSGGILLFLMIFFCFIDVSRNGFVSKCFGLIWCYIFPSLSLIFFNLFIQGHFSDCKHRNLNLLTLLSQLFHYCLGFCFLFQGILNVMTAHYLYNSLFFNGSKEGIVSILYLFISIHLNLYFIHKNDGMLMARAILSILMTIYQIANPIYYSFVMNSLALSYSIYECVIPIMILINNNLGFKYFISLPIIIAVSFLIEIITRKIQSNSSKIDLILHLSYIRKFKEAKKLLEVLDLKLITESNFVKIVRLALYVQPSNLEDIMKYVQQYTTNFYNSFFIWSANNIFISLTGEILEGDETVVLKFIQNIDKLELKFMYHVWRSEILSLPKILSKLSSEKYRLISFLYNNYTRSPKLCNLVSEDIKNEFYKKIKLSKRWFLQKSKGISLNFMHITFFVLVVVFGILLFYTDTKFSPFKTEFKKFSKFSISLLRFQKELLIDGQNLSNEVNYNNSYNSFLEYYNQIVELNEDYKTQLLNYQHNNKTFIQSTELYIECIKNNHDSQIQACSNESIELLDFFKNSLMDFKFINVEESKNLLSNVKTGLKHVSITLTVILFLIYAISYFVLIFKYSKIYHSFALIPKSKISEKYHFEQKKSSSKEIQTNFLNASFIFKLKWTLYFHIIFVIYFLVINGSIWVSMNSLMNEHKEILKFIHDYSKTSIIPFCLMSSGNKYFANYSFEEIKEEFDNIGTLIDGFNIGNVQDEYVELIPSYAYSLMFEISNSNEFTMKIEEYSNLVQEMVDNLNDTLTDYEINTKGYTVQYIIYIILMCSLYSVSYLILANFYEFKKAEKEEPIKLLSNINESLNSEVNTEKIDKRNKVSYKISEIPFSVFIVDNHKTVTFLTDLCREKYNLKLGKNISESNIDTSTLNLLEEQFDKFQNHFDQSICIIPLESNKDVLIMRAYYLYKDESMKLQSITVAIDSMDNNSVVANELYETIFYKFYPVFIDKNEKLPIQLNPTLKSFFVIIIKLDGFNSLIENNVNLGIITHFRKELYNCFESLNQEEFCIVRRTSDTIVFSLNKEQTKLSIWKILQVATDFGKILYQETKKLIDKYKLNIKIKILFFKCREPSWYLPNSPVSFTDWMSTILIQAETYLKNGEYNIFNYCTQKKEIAIINTTKLCNSHTPNGEPYEIFLVV